MEGLENLTKEEVMELIKDFPLTPLFNNVIITSNVVEIDEDEIENPVKMFSEKQYVLAVGSHIRDIKPGDKVLLNLEKMMEQSTSATNSYEITGQLKLKPIDVGERVFAMIEDRKIDAVYNS